MAVIIDPNIRILPVDHKVFVLHPGSSKKFYMDFVETSSVFLDLPGITFDTTPSKDAPELRQRIRMARQISAWVRTDRDPLKKPSRNLSDYIVANPSANAPKIVHEIVQLYSEAKAGDLVIVPGKGYNSTVYIGEFANDFDPEFTVSTIRYGAEKIPARKVNWFPVNLAKHQFDRSLIKLMQNRQAIIKISGDRDCRKIYSIVYGDYIWKESSGNFIRVTEDEIDLNDLNKAVDLTNYFAAQYIALKNKQLEKFFELGFSEAIDRYYDKSYFGGVSVEVHSPGFFSRKMKDVRLAGYVSAMLALSVSGVTAQEAINIEVQNSANSSPSICDQDLESDIREVMEMYANIHLWESDICIRRLAAKETVGLKTDVIVKTNK